MLTLELADVSKKYKVNSWVLHNVSTTIKSGIYALIGPNGAGKTTLLRLMVGMLRPSSGRILFKGQDIRQDYGLYKQSIGYLPQEFGFYPNMTGRNFLHYMARLKGIPSSLYPVRVEEVAQYIGVTSFLDKKIGVWSVGLKRRLGIAQALLADPDVLILDEPMIGLDLEEKLFIWNYFSHLSRERIIICSSNILTDFTTFTDGVLLLVNGEVRFNGPIQELTDLMYGKVWVADVPVESRQAIENSWAVSELNTVEEFCQIRIVSDIIPDIPGVRLTQPRIKDAYTYIVRRKEPEQKE